MIVRYVSALFLHCFFKPFSFRKRKDATIGQRSGPSGTAPPTYIVGGHHDYSTLVGINHDTMTVVMAKCFSTRR